jgi:hypothetical protein
MSKFTVNVPLVSYYEVEIEAENEAEARLAVTRLVPSDLPSEAYQGWDVDFSNLVVSEAPEGYCEHGVYVGGVMEDFMCAHCEAL